MTSLFLSVDEVNAELFVPAFVPLIFHWYEGVPPFVGVAVNVTEVPSQTGPDGEAAIVTDVVKGDVTLIVIPLEVAGFPVTHDSLEVNVHVTTSLFEGAYENEELLVPASVPLTFH